MAGAFARARQALKAAVGIYTDDSVRQAWGMLTGIQPGGLGSPPPRGTQNYLTGYSKMPWLRAVASRISTAVAATEWKLFVVRATGQKARKMTGIQRCKSHARRAKLLKQVEQADELVEITDHPMLDVIHQANDFQTGEAARKVTQLHLDLVGEAFWLKERDGLGLIIGIWPLPPHWVLSTPTPTYRFFRVGYRAWRAFIPDTEILWMVDPDPANPYTRGSGTAQALSDELETDEYAAKHLKSFFYNRAKPDLLVYPKQGNMREEDVRRLEEDWMNKNQGFWRAFKPYFLNREVGVHELDQNFRQLQMVQLREYERNVIIQTFGMPPELLGVLQHSNRATISAADYLMSRYVTEPRLEFLRSVFQEQLVPEYDERLIVDYESPVQDDRELELQAATVAPWSLTVDEWRELAGQTALEDDAGQVHMLPANTTPLTMAAATARAMRVVSRPGLDLPPPEGQVPDVTPEAEPDDGDGGSVGAGGATASQVAANQDGGTADTSTAADAGGASSGAQS